MKNDLANEILNLKKEKNALILAHNYQNKEVIDIADFVGDSYGLSKKAAYSDAEVIIFCGVYFMAETASILAPEKKIVLPEISAGCYLADTIDYKNVRELRENYPDAAVVCYVNSTAEVKAESDACCTSANAVKVVNSLPHKQIIFVPDKNLASYVSQHTNKEIIVWKGFCNPHNKITFEDVKKAKSLYPDAVLLVHPECRKEVVEQADFIGGTTNMQKYVKESNKDKFIVGTEIGMIYPLKKENPKKEFYPLSDSLICNDMKLITVKKVYDSLQNLKPQIKVEKHVANKTLKALNRMLESS